jgi:transcriptional regulator GlxA family with amidase domain
MSIRCHLVRTAIEMIEAKLTLLCGEAVSALAIEGQVGVRALQPAFQCQIVMSPMGYLRLLRCGRARTC